MAFRSDTLTTEFKQSIIEHTFTSGREANCFFQSFFHTLTAQDSKVLNSIKLEYKDSVQAFVDTVNKTLSLDPPIDFDKIIEISKSLHPLERECVFGPILRKTYNTMLKNGLITGTSGRELRYGPKEIVFNTETAAFSRAFGVQIYVYMDEDELKRSKAGGMPSDVAERVTQTEFRIGDKLFYCDHEPQELKSGKTFDLNIVFAGKHLNYTLGDSKRNHEYTNLIVTKTSPDEGIYADKATIEKDAPLAKIDLDFSDIANELCNRFQLKRSEDIEVKKEKLSTTAVMLTSMPLAEEKTHSVLHDSCKQKATEITPSTPTKSNTDLTLNETANAMIENSGQHSNPVRKLQS